MDTILIHHARALGLVVFPLLSAYPWCRFPKESQHFGIGRNLRYSVVLPSGFRAKIKTQIALLYINYISNKNLLYSTEKSI